MVKKLFGSLKTSHRYALTAWIIVFTASTGWANWTSYQNAQDQKHEDERACERTLRNRDENEMVLIRIATDAGAEPSTIALIHRTYDNLAPPAGCKG